MELIKAQNLIGCTVGCPEAIVISFALIAMLIISVLTAFAIFYASITCYYLLFHFKGTCSYLAKTAAMFFLMAPACLLLIIASICYPIIYLSRYIRVKSYKSKKSRFGFSKITIKINKFKSLIINIATKNEKPLKVENSTENENTKPCKDNAGVIHLVHGTFEPEAEWTQIGSKMRKKLSKSLPDFQINRIEWTGGNGYEDREEAVKKIRDEIKLSPTHKHYLIGHSHAGNIIENFIRQNKENPIADKNINGVCLLSTPFIFVDKFGRKSGTLQYLHAIGFVLYVEMIFFVILRIVHPHNISSYAVIGGIIVGAIALAIDLWATKNTKTGVESLIKKENANLVQNDVLIIQSVGDEADAGLRFTSALHEVCFSILAQLKSADEIYQRERLIPYTICFIFYVTCGFLSFSTDWLEETFKFSLAGGAFFSFITLIIVDRVNLKDCRLERGSKVSEYVTIIGFPVAIIAFYLNAIKALAFGDWRLIFNPSIFIHSSETPCGKYEIIKLPPLPDSNLNHSTHSRDDVINIINEWIMTQESKLSR